MCVAGANKRYCELMLRNQWDSGIDIDIHDIAAIKVKQGHFETAILVFHNLPSSITAKSE